METSTHVTSDHRLTLRIMPRFKDLCRGCRVMTGWQWRGQWPRRAVQQATVTAVKGAVAEVHVHAARLPPTAFQQQV